VARLTAESSSNVDCRKMLIVLCIISVASFQFRLVDALFVALGFLSYNFLAVGPHSTRRQRFPVSRMLLRSAV
jgi:hypothetical protein